VIALPPRCFQQPDVPDVEKVEASVGKDNALANSLPGCHTSHKLIQLQHFVVDLPWLVLQQNSQEFFLRNRGGTDFADHNSRSYVGQTCRHLDWDSARQSQRKDSDDRIARSRNVEDLVGNCWSVHLGGTLQHCDSLVAKRQRHKLHTEFREQPLPCP
jgi:hypothetical protein